MVSSRKLSSDEVDALIEGLQTDGESATSSDVSGSANVRPFKFGSDDLTLLGDYYALRMINERFARFSRAVFLPMLRIQPRISSFPPEVKTFDEYTSGIESFMSLTASRLEELRGNMMTVMDPTFISILTNSFYGGQLGPDKSKKTEFTSTEDRLIEIISEGLNRMLEAAWKDLMPINLSVQGREVNPQFVSFVDGAELVIICSFVVQLPGMDAANFDLIYPLQTLKPIASLLRSKVQSDVVEDDVSWRERLERAILEIPLKISARLSEPVVSMSKLINVKPGEVIPIQIGEGVEVRVEGKPIFLGEMGEVSGQSAINLNKRLSS
ncbi:MAG: flagellar motor switch protein FliM [Paracoccaceae bacterium]|nr:flagellar motor switch protein FliM [Paracoccaceae bacterium]